jgi:hypothetical protein
MCHQAEPDVETLETGEASESRGQFAFQRSGSAPTNYDPEMSETPVDVPAGWHPDPRGRHDMRYWDGAKWTDHVSDAGVTSTDPVTKKKSLFARLEDAVTVGDDQSDEAKARVRGQVDGEGRFGTGMQARNENAGGGSLFTEPVLVVN